MLNRKLIIVVIVLLCLTLACSLTGDAESDEAESPPLDESVSEEVASPPEEAAEPVPQEEDFNRPVDGMLMLYIPAGEFIMGQDESPFKAEKPAHLVNLTGYWMDQTEVTNAMYRQCVAAEVCLHRPTLDDPKLNGDLYPALVTWEDAQTYCNWVATRLTTEAEWEKAARGTDERLWPWGNEFEPGKANLTGDDDGYKLTAPVGIFPAGNSPYGLQDMAGNASEWVADWFDVDYYTASSQDNPSGPANGEQKVYRSSIANGGSGPEKCRTIARYGGEPDSDRWLYGFRCATSVKIEP